MITAAKPIHVEALTKFCFDAFRTAGVNETDAKVATDVLVTADTWGVFTHGSKLLAGYLRRLLAGGWNAKAVPRLDREGPSWGIVDGASGLGPVASVFAMRVAMRKAKVTGVAYVGLRNTGHIAAAGVYASIAAREGLIGVATANDVPTVAAPGSRGAILGSNPFAFGVPAGARDPILLDMATSIVAGGKVYAAQQRGESIPPHWLIGPDGRPTNDLSLFPRNAVLAPMAGHKGYGIALLVETLAGLLTGGAVTGQIARWSADDPAKPSRNNAAFIAIDVASMMDAETFGARVDALIDEIHAAPTAEGAERIYLPGEMEWERRRNALQNGVVLPKDVILKLIDASKQIGFRPDWLGETSDAG